MENWFCANCTELNPPSRWRCKVCNRVKETDTVERDPFVPKLEEEPSTWICPTVVGYDGRLLRHSMITMNSQHRERPDRLRAVVKSLLVEGILPRRCKLIFAREISNEELSDVHSDEHIEAIDRSSAIPLSYFPGDTYANKHSAYAARLAAGLCAELASSIMGGEAKNGFALVRPPGHLAGVKQADGFCLFNNAAVAAFAALRANAKRVLVFDWGVRHGKGTQEIFWSTKSVLYISLHRHEGGRFYPGTGAANEVGDFGSEGYTVNIPWSSGGVTDADYIFAFKQIVLPIASEFAPDFIIISAGFDAARGDPLGGCEVTPAGFARMTYLLSALAEGKLLLILEGGYNLQTLSTSVVAVIKVLLGDYPHVRRVDDRPSKKCLDTVEEVMSIQEKFWPNLRPKLITLISARLTLSCHNQGTGLTAARGDSPDLSHINDIAYVDKQIYGDAMRCCLNTCIGGLRKDRVNASGALEAARNVDERSKQALVNEQRMQEIIKYVEDFRTEAVVMLVSFAATIFSFKCKWRYLVLVFSILVGALLGYSSSITFSLVREARKKFLLHGQAEEQAANRFDELIKKKLFVYCVASALFFIFLVLTFFFCVHTSNDPLVKP